MNRIGWVAGLVLALVSCATEQSPPPAPERVQAPVQPGPAASPAPAPSAPGPAAASSAPASPARGVSGTFTANGQASQLRHAYAFSGPDTFDRFREVTYVLLTADPLPENVVTAATDPKELIGAAKGGYILVQIDADGNFWLRATHPASDREVQSSGPRGDLRVRDGRVSGRLSPFGGREENMGNNRYQIDLAIDAALVKRFAVSKEPSLSAAASALPAGGGDPGRAFLLECKAKEFPYRDFNSFRAALQKDKALPTDADVKAEAAKRGKPVTRDQMVRELFDAMRKLSALSPQECKVLGGKSDGKVAVLDVEAIVGGKRLQTEYTLVIEGTAWKIEKEGAWRTPATAEKGADPPAAAKKGRTPAEKKKG